MFSGFWLYIWLSVWEVAVSHASVMVADSG